MPCFVRVMFKRAGSKDQDVEKFLHAAWQRYPVIKGQIRLIAYLNSSCVAAMLSIQAESPDSEVVANPPGTGATISAMVKVRLSQPATVVEGID